jgi:hypothetical protein
MISNTTDIYSFGSGQAFQVGPFVFHIDRALSHMQLRPLAAKWCFFRGVRKLELVLQLTSNIKERFSDATVTPEHSI